MDIKNDLLVKHIQEVPTYQPPPTLEAVSREVGIPIENIIKLDTNENPYGAIPEVRDALGALRTAHLYPDKEYDQVLEGLSQLHDIPSKHFIIGSGADEIIDLTMRVTLEPGDVMLNRPPAFSMYDVNGRLNRADVVEIPRGNDFSYDFEGIQKAIAKHHPKLMFIANPNNPDGTVLPNDLLEKLLDLPILLVIDEAYIDFCDLPSVDRMVMERDNLAVIRTFSKWAGLAGMRLGYGIFPDQIAEMVFKAKQPYNVSVTALIAGLVTLKNKAKADVRIEKIIKNSRFTI